MSVKTVEKHYVTFVSPGTLFAESSTKPIDSWDTRKAVELATTVTERYGAKPRSFYFSTYLEVDHDVRDSSGRKFKVEPQKTAESGQYYIQGRIETYDEVFDRNDKTEDILRSNIRCNRMPVLVVTTNSYRSVNEFEEKDSIVNSEGTVTECGDAKKWIEYRARINERIDQYYKTL